ncbi:YciI family protein [Blastococcus deserti]|uniref:YciI family protein n=1 Tax=Blastococcus deserti TaxID=2259033 RepID=A0ABW4XFE5_9ACTN
MARRGAGSSRLGRTLRTRSQGRAEKAAGITQDAARDGRQDAGHGVRDDLPRGREPMNGDAMGIFTSREAAEEFVAGDPFVVNGVVASWSVRPWNEILQSS